MKDRAEPRFPTDTPGMVEVIRGEAHSLQARVADVSATGFQMETAESLEPGETVRLSIDGYQMLGEVRYCNPHDATYKIGIERVDDWTGAVKEDQTAPLGRPAIKNPLGSLRAISMRELFADPRLRNRKRDYGMIVLLVAAIALALCAGLATLLTAMGHR